MHIVSARLYFGEKSALLNDTQADPDCRPIQFNRDFAQNGDRKYDGETSEDVPRSFAYSS